MRTLLPDPPPPEFEQLLKRRRRWGADTRDEVWEGVVHMNPAPHGRHAKAQARVLRVLGPHADAADMTVLGEFNLGDDNDYRVPDGGLLRAGPDELYNATSCAAAAARLACQKVTGPQPARSPSTGARTVRVS